MDALKQVGKGLKKTANESADNTRRVAENFPYVERKNDEVIYNKPYKMTFNMSNHPHSVRLNLYIKAASSCFKCNTNFTGPPSTLSASYTNATFPSLGETATPAEWQNTVTNVGGFALSTEGITVPQDGIYTAHFIADAGGVTIAADTAAVIGTIRHNGVILSQSLFTVAKGNLGAGYTSAGISLYGLCVPSRAGDVINGWVAGTGIAFFNVSGTSLAINRVGLL